MSEAKRRRPKPSRKRARPRRAVSKRARHAVSLSPTSAEHEPVGIVPGATFPIVGIGASAGGVEAVGALLEPIPPEIDMTFVVVQHLSPHTESHLPAVLSSMTRLNVAHASKDTKLMPGHVHVVPPDRFIELTDGHLRLTQRPDDRRQFTPINHFFSTLATFGGTRGIGVVLSGNASDGATGLREIKAAGGITMAQDPSTAKFDSMPRAAIASEVDFILPPPLLAQELIRIASHPVVRRVDGDEPPLADWHKAEIREILRLLRENGGIDFSNYKMPTVLRRLHRQMVLRRVPTIAAYLETLRTDPKELAALRQSILIHVTRFFRDPDAFVALGKLIGKLTKTRSRQEPIRVWVPACSTGEEAYSVAMILLEELGHDSRRVPVQVFGTDVSDHAVERARKAVYPEGITADISPERLRKFFTKTDGTYHVTKSVRDLCIFARHDVTHDPPFARLDLILCRNLLIYLDLTLQRRLLYLFYYALNQNGLLMLGSAETIGGQAEYFEPLDGRARIFAKKGGPVAHYPMPLTGSFFRPSPERAQLPVESRVLDGHKDADRLILERFSPAALLLDGAYFIREIRGDVRRFLHPSTGNASLVVFKMVRPALASALRPLLQRSRETHKAVRATVHVKTDHKIEAVVVEVVPIPQNDGAQQFLVLFEAKPQARRETKAIVPAGTSKRSAMATKLADLQRELEQSRLEQQAMIHDLEAANEELQSANEEFLSSNEELQSTNEELDTAREELQSTNEEIITVNEELHGRNEDLAGVNSDLINLLGVVQIPIVIVDGDLNIRRFTPLAEKLFNLIPSDVRRPIAHIKPSFECPNLETLVRDCIEKATMEEREIQDSQGRWFALKVRPYKNVDNRIDGAVIVLTDIDVWKTQKLEEGIVEAMVDASDAMMVVLSEAFVITHASWAFAALVGAEQHELIGESLFEIENRNWEDDALRSTLDQVLTRGIALDGYITAHGAGGGATRRLLVSARRVKFHDGEGDRVLLTIKGSD